MNIHLIYLLDCSVKSFILVNVYSPAAVLSPCPGEVGEYQVPYQNCVPNDPSIEDMKKIVVTEGLRPDLEERWKTSEVSNMLHPFVFQYL